MKYLCLSFLLAAHTAFAQDECAATWKCHPVTGSPPVLDADFADWANVAPYTTSLVDTFGKVYDAGDSNYKCLYDSDYIYFAMEIPGEYRFSTEDNKLCAAISTMMKIGEDATYVNMGGCPDAMDEAGCGDSAPATCDSYRVDIGGHWELKGTEQSTLYSMSSTVTAGSATDRQENATAAAPENPPGNDLIANKDDEYAVSSFCRFDDDDANADNEWSGAWAHTNPVEGEFGNYHFEMSRTLKTASTETDAQLTPGETVQFGIAFWDPFQLGDAGWNDIGHFVTGCGLKWIDLELSTDPAPEMETGSVAGDLEEEADKVEDEIDGDSSAATFNTLMSFALVASVVAGLR